MESILLMVVIVLALANLVAVGMLLLRRPGDEAGHARLEEHLCALERHLERMERGLAEQLAGQRKESTEVARQLREEVSHSIKAQGDTALKGMGEVATAQGKQLDAFSHRLQLLTAATEDRLEKLRATIEARLTHLQQDNAAKLDLMRATVDEKLQGTLEKRLGESFKQVSERLEQVHKGLGEMQNLATGVGDLKKIMTNVKTRGTWGEWQLGMILEQILTPDQYAQNVACKEHSAERVEFVVKLPGREGEGLAGECVLLPIDAKFPQEDYQRIVDATERADVAAVEEAVKNLELRVRGMARDIKDKYLNPPRTTDFGILYLPTEGLFAEVTRRQGLLESLQRDCRVIVAGPTTLAMILNSLQVGFRTLTIQKRSSEVWNLLGTVKVEFGKFGDILDGVKKRLEQAVSTMEDAQKKTRTIERRLKDVQALPAAGPDVLPAKLTLQEEE